MSCASSSSSSSSCSIGGLSCCPMPYLLALFALYGLYTVMSCLHYVLLFIVLAAVWLKMADADLALLYASYRTSSSSSSSSSPSVSDARVLWVTGASSGIGEWTAYEYARAGWRVILSARDQQQLKRVKQRCVEQGASADDVVVLPMDALQFDSHSGVVDAAYSAFSRIDVLLLNHGRSQRALAEDTEVACTRQLIELNVMSYISLTKLMLPRFFSQGHGHIAVTSSMAGVMCAPIISSYNASKFALQGYFTALRMEVRSRNIDVTIILPGPVCSSIEENAVTGRVGERLNTTLEDKSKKMTTQRCAWLIYAGLSARLHELWISPQPVLLFAYISNYAPDLLKWLSNNVMAPARMRAFREKQDVYSIKSFFSFLQPKENKNSSQTASTSSSTSQKKK